MAFNWNLFSVSSFNWDIFSVAAFLRYVFDVGACLRNILNNFLMTYLRSIFSDVFNLVVVLDNSFNWDLFDNCLSYIFDSCLRNIFDFFLSDIFSNSFFIRNILQTTFGLWLRLLVVGLRNMMRNSDVLRGMMRYLLMLRDMMRDSDVGSLNVLSSIMTN